MTAKKKRILGPFGGMKTFRLFLFVALFAPVMALGQFTDGGVWAGVSLKKDLPNGFDLGFDFQGRTELMASHLATVFTDVEGSYKVNKWLKTSVTYRFGLLNSLEGYQATRHRFALDASVDRDFGKPKFDFRVRYQAGQRSTSEEGISDLRDAIRYRLKGQVKLIKKTYLASSLEYFQSLDLTRHSLTDWRWKIGVERKVKKRQYLAIGYLLQSEMNANDPLTEHVLTVGYTFEFK